VSVDGRTSRVRIAIGVVGVGLGLFGVYRLLTQLDARDLLYLMFWLIGALVIHDGLLSPIVVGVGAALARLPRRARTFVQGGLLAGAFVTVIAIPMIYRRNSQPRVKAILQQNFGLNLVSLLAVILVGTFGLYLVRVLRGRQAAASSTNSRPLVDHDPASE
jgi:hypothetical protein